MSPEILIAILAAAAVLLITFGLAARPSEDAVQARLSQLVVQPKSLEEMELQQPFFDRVHAPDDPATSRAGRRQEGGMIARIDAKLEKAGYPGGLRGADWVGVKILSLIAFAIIGFLLGLLITSSFVLALLFALGGGALGYSLPSSGWAGRSGHAAWRWCSSSPTPWTCSPSPSRPVSASMRPSPRSSRRWRARWSTSSARRWPRSGWGDRGAMRCGMSRTRADAQPVSNFIGAIVQAEQLGVPIAKVLQIQSNQLRIERRQRAEEAAAKAPVKMLFPMVGCIFPTIFIVILGPAVITVMGSGL